MARRVRAVRRGGVGLVTGLCLLVTALTGGCADDGDGSGPGGRGRPVPPTDAHRDAPRLLEPPPPPRTKPPLPPGRVVDGKRAAPVLDRVPTRDRVVFLTIDDGTAKDPRFAALMRELRVPFSMFLTDSMAGDDYAYFDRLRGGGKLSAKRDGNRVQNHTLTHPSLAGLPYPAQRKEICGQQDRLQREFGQRPTLFRPPRGHYDSTTLRAVADCGVRASVMWGVNMQPDGLRYDHGGTRLRPGEIVLFHFFGAGQLRGTELTDLTLDLLRTITEQGYAVARLEDYV
ncbi:polysaccharide deacetylase family protein [Streptomyces monticola]|uniref:Polysaccharide deacetylase family protein n=1 Tax=Streptomyces monticola TaxID=2666263 RepID=A0ABW2JUS2_9ACTN